MCQQSHNNCVEVTRWLKKKKHVCILREFSIFRGGGAGGGGFKSYHFAVEAGSMGVKLLPC